MGESQTFKSILSICLLDLLVVIVGTMLWKFSPQIFNAAGKDALFLNLIIVFVGLITFFGFLIVGNSIGGSWHVTKGGMRVAITASVVTIYIVLIGLTSFLTKGAELPEITKTMISSFTTTISVVIAFYFGTSAYIEVQERRSAKNERNGERNGARLK